jgi:restriction system protein
LLITTGSFTADAKHEATREGAPPIDLTDGDRLCELLKEYSLGVQTHTWVIEDVAIEPHFFSEFSSVISVADWEVKETWCQNWSPSTGG